MQPVSAMAVVLVVGGEGASFGVLTVSSILCWSSFACNVESLGGLAVPLPYLDFLGPQILSDPSFLSLMVASSWCPSALLLHVLLVCFKFWLLPWVQQ